MERISSLVHESFLPSTAVLELTYKCNHACRFCCCPWYAGMIRPGREMCVGEWKACLDELCSAGVSHFSFTGGEMLLKKGWEEIVRYAAGLKTCQYKSTPQGLVVERETPMINILSNGKIMNEDVLDLCLQYNLHLSMSLPGISSYSSLTCGGTEPEHVLTWFERARDKGVAATAGITVTSENFHELFETVSIALIAGASGVLINRFLPGGRGLAHRELDLTAGQIREIPFIVERALSLTGRKGHIGTEYPYCLALGTDKLENIRVGTTCGAAVSFFVVGPNGKIRVCNHSPRELNHWKKWNMLMKNEYWRQFIFKEYLPDLCRGCRFSSRCDGGCPEASHVCFGSPSEPDPAFYPLSGFKQP